MNALLNIYDLSCFYRKNRPVLGGLSLSLYRGEVVGLLGLNGSGKSTLFRCILGELPYAGSILFEGKPLERKRIARAIGYIPQEESAPALSVLDFVLLAFYDELLPFSSPTRTQRERALAMLSEMGLSAYADEDFASLSGGEKQLCLLARTFLRPCPLLVLDEPDASLDARNKKRVLGLLKQRAKEENRTVFLSLHDLSFALNYCERILLLNGGIICADFAPHKTPLEEIESLLKPVYGKVKAGVLHGETDLLVAVTEEV